MKVSEWISYEDAESRECSIGGLGGWFDDGHRWEDYALQTEIPAYAEAIRESVIERQLRYTGGEHQNREDGVPLFENGTVGIFSYRAWGDLMAAIWSTKEDKDYSYMDFYC